MTYWDSFTHGLFKAFSWKDDKINVLLGGEPQWTYILGLFVHFAFWIFILYVSPFKDVLKIKKQQGSWKGYLDFVKSNLKSMGKSKTFLALFFLSTYLIGLPYYLGYRLTNGIWRYHYFTSQVTTKELAAMANFDLYVGGYKSNHASIEADLILANEPYQKINVSNATKDSTIKLRTVTNQMPVIPVYAWIREDKRVIYISFE